MRNHGSLCVPQGTDGLTTMQGLPDAVDIKAQVSIRFFPRNSEDTSAEWSAGSRPDWLDLNVQTHWKKHQQGFKQTGDVTYLTCSHAEIGDSSCWPSSDVTAFISARTKTTGQKQQKHSILMQPVELPFDLWSPLTAITHTSIMLISLSVRRLVMT